MMTMTLTETKTEAETETETVTEAGTEPLTSSRCLFAVVTFGVTLTKCCKKGKAATATNQLP